MHLDLDIFNEELIELSQEAYPSTDIFSIKNKWTLYWLPDLLPIPVRSIFTRPILLEEDISNCGLMFESNSHLFNMNNDLEQKIYNIIKTRALSGWYLITKEETKWDDTNSVLIWLEWAQRYYENNPINNTNETNTLF